MLFAAFAALAAVTGDRGCRGITPLGVALLICGRGTRRLAYTPATAFTGRSRIAFSAGLLLGCGGRAVIGPRAFVAAVTTYMTVVPLQIPVTLNRRRRTLLDFLTLTGGRIAR